MPQLRTSMEYVVGMVLREWKITRQAFDALSDEEQEDMVAHYLAGMRLQRWQNYRDWYRMQNLGGQR
ncbi:hypothetical protein D3C87_1665100 [compost metagenome]